MPTVRQIVEFLGAIGETAVAPPAGGDGEREVLGVSQDWLARPSDLAWLSPKHAARDPQRVGAFGGALLVTPLGIGAGQPAGGGIVVPCAHPKVAFSRAVQTFFAPLAATHWPDVGQGGITPGTHLGERVRLGPGVVLGSGVSIGDDVVVGPNSCLANCTVGARVTIGCNSTVGLPGFGYEKDAAGAYWRFPHTGRVVLEEDVEIGSNSCIDRGAIGDTVIGRGSKIDNLVHIAHNVVIGRDVVVIAHSMIGGSTTIEDGAWVAPSVAVMNQIRIGRGATLGLGAVVLKDVAAATVVVGNPAKPLERREPK